MINYFHIFQKVTCEVRGHECEEASLYNEFLGGNRVADGRLSAGARLPLRSELTGPMREHGLLCELVTFFCCHKKSIKNIFLIIFDFLNQYT
jgi:hypothetical protein